VSQEFKTLCQNQFLGQCPKKSSEKGKPYSATSLQNIFE
jgi:hypothetical protein